MFSFHKPKVYRSTTGCCICKAKSSSSRFTDSKKYEEDFIECFQLDEQRTGEICNACVLLVKRWKKLPPDSGRNWRHVVDARAGPGIKSLTKFKAKNKKKVKDNIQEKFEKIVKKKHVYLKPEREQSPVMSDDLTEEYIAGNESKSSSRSGSPSGSDDAGTGEKILIRGETAVKNHLLEIGILIDLSYFKRESYCCRNIFRGLCGEIITELKLKEPCENCSLRQRPRLQPQQQQVAQQQRQQQVPQEGTVLGNSPAHSSASASPEHSSASTSPAHSLESGPESAGSKSTSKIFSDYSSDSGYDESSNQGPGESKLAKFIQRPAIKIQPIKSVQLKAIPASEAVRLKADVPMKLVPIKQLDSDMPMKLLPLKQQVEPLVCKPVSLVASADHHLNLSNSTSNAAATVPNNPLVDFAMQASSRESLSN